MAPYEPSKRIQRNYQSSCKNSQLYYITARRSFKKASLFWLVIAPGYSMQDDWTVIAVGEGGETGEEASKSHNSNN